MKHIKQFVAQNDLALLCTCVAGCLILGLGSMYVAQLAQDVGFWTLTAIALFSLGLAMYALIYNNPTDKSTAEARQHALILLTAVLMFQVLLPLIEALTALAFVWQWIIVAAAIGAMFASFHVSYVALACFVPYVAYALYFAIEIVL